jgi:hypothetical protein
MYLVFYYEVISTKMFFVSRAIDSARLMNNGLWIWTWPIFDYTLNE